MEMIKNQAYLYHHTLINKLEMVSSSHSALKRNPNKKEELLKIIQSSKEIVLDTLDRMFRFEIIPHKWTKDKIKELLDYGKSMDWENPQEVDKYFDRYRI